MHRQRDRVEFKGVQFRVIEDGDDGAVWFDVDSDQCFSLAGVFPHNSGWSNPELVAILVKKIEEGREVCKASAEPLALDSVEAKVVPGIRF